MRRLITLEKANEIRELARNKPHLTLGQIKMITKAPISTGSIFKIIKGGYYAKKEEGHAKLSDAQIRYIRNYFKFNSFKRRTVERRRAIEYIAESFKVEPNCVYQILRGVRRNDNYSWRAIRHSTEKQQAEISDAG